METPTLKDFAEARKRWNPVDDGCKGEFQMKKPRMAISCTPPQPRSEPEAQGPPKSIEEVASAVKDGLNDPVSTVRCASLDLMGKVLISDLDNFDNYFPYLLQASQDGALCVRRKVIGIIGKICKTAPIFPEVTSLLVCAFATLRDEVATMKLAAKKFLFEYLLTNIYVENPSRRALIFAETFNLCRYQDFSDLFQEFLRILMSDDMGEHLSVYVDSLLEALISNFVELNFIKVKLELAACDNSLYEKYSAAMIETVQVLPVMAECFPNTFLKYIDVIVPFLALCGSAESRAIAGFLLSSIEASLNRLEFLSTEFMAAMDKMLITHLQTSDADGNMPALRCLAILGKHGNFSTKLFTLFLSFLREANIARLAFECKTNPVAKKSVVSSYLNSAQFDTVLALIGRITSYFNIDLMLFEDSTTANSLYVDIAVEHDAIMGSISRNEEEPYFKDVYSLLETFAFGFESPHAAPAFRGLGLLTAPRAKYLLKEPLRSAYMRLLISDDAKDDAMKILVLKNLNVFVDRQSEVIGEQTEKEDNSRNPVMKDLLVVVQHYWDSVKRLIYSQNESLRLNTVKFITNVVGRKLVVPHNSASVLISMVSDSLVEIQSLALKCLKGLDHLLAQNEALHGVRGSFKLLKVISNSAVVRGYTDAGEVAVLDAYFKLWRNEKKVRRNIFSKLLAVFGFEDVLSGEPVTINELLYLTDNLATFSFALMDEPLFIIKFINDILRRSETVVLEEFEQILKPANDETVFEFTAKSIFERLPEDRSLIDRCYLKLVKVTLLKGLKLYLANKYSLTDKSIAECRIAVSPKIGNKLLPKKAANTKKFNVLFVKTYLKQQDTDQGWLTVAKHFAHSYQHSLKNSDEESV